MKKWSFLRVLRLVLGVGLFVTGIQTGEFIPFLLAGFLLYQAVLNKGCASCSVNNQSCSNEVR